MQNASLCPLRSWQQSYQAIWLYCYVGRAIGRFELASAQELLTYPSLSWAPDLSNHHEHLHQDEQLEQVKTSTAVMAAANLDALHVPEQHLWEHNAEPLGHQRGYIKGTDYSTPYTSQWSRLHAEESADLLRSLNCSYLSTHGVPPTLLSLKQHAQALCNLILMLAPTTNPGQIDADNASDPLAVRYRMNEAFDFLNDLRKPYQNADPAHQLPLNSLVNEVKAKTDLGGTEFHCALEASPKPRGLGVPIRPYENHHNLVMHANDCLERLDHEFSSEGGLMAILPGDAEHDSADKKAARNSLLGQWLGFTQHLVRRTHELEIAYGNALDIVQSDAVLPLQHLSSLGPDGRSVGRQIAFPQDRWVLANAGDDVYEYINKLLDAREAVNQEKDRMWKEQGVTSERNWRGSKDGQIVARGIVAINVTTRYYRLAGKGHGTVFVVPAWDVSPAVEYTRTLEKGPGVVGVPAAKWPERMTEIEKRFQQGNNNREALQEGIKATEAALTFVAKGESVRKELERVVHEVEVLEEFVGESGMIDINKIAVLKQQTEQTRNLVLAQREHYRTQVESLKREINELRGRVREYQQMAEAGAGEGGRKRSRSATVGRDAGEGRA